MYNILVTLEDSQNKSWSECALNSSNSSAEFGILRISLFVSVHSETAFIILFRYSKSKAGGVKGKAKGRKAPKMQELR
jgi:hypothetical protein